jgi:hypothetical protein
LKVMEVVSNLEAQVTAEGEASAKLYAEAETFCEDRTKELAFQIKTEKSEIAELMAHIEDKTATITAPRRRSKSSVLPSLRTRPI